MNAISAVIYNAATAHNASRAAEVAMGLGPNQLTWLRRRIGAFKDLEDQRHLVRQDAVRAARMAGLI